MDQSLTEGQFYWFKGDTCSSRQHGEIGCDMRLALRICHRYSTSLVTLPLELAGKLIELPSPGSRCRSAGRGHHRPGASSGSRKPKGGFLHCRRSSRISGIRRRRLEIRDSSGDSTEDPRCQRLTKICQVEPCSTVWVALMHTRHNHVKAASAPPGLSSFVDFRPSRMDFQSLFESRAMVQQFETCWHSCCKIYPWVL